MTSAEIVLAAEEGAAAYAFGERGDASAKNLHEQLDDAAAHNPFAAAFASESDPFEDAAHNAFNFSPYQLGSVYGEDTISLLAYDDPEDQKPQRPRRSSDLYSDSDQTAYGAKGLPAREWKEEKKTSSSSACSFLGLVLCIAEWRVFSELDRALLQKEANLVRQAFYVHWIHMLGLVTNCVVCGALVLGEAPSAGNGRESIPSFTAWMWSIGYLVVGSYAGWYSWTRQLYVNFKTESSAAWSWFDACFALHTAFTCVLIAGIPGSGSAGIISIIMLRNWLPRFTFALVASSVAIAFQGIVLVWSLCLWRQVHRRRQGRL
ncbi:Secretory carrier-associated membrane protein [Hondaea fermentalgiana]|uniref:Secretory carrier-associated membrane protein n=1 Tax=Hondaea fermentalgiana TaxID=2315210 RepID=A0A2R5GR75_9STRA|nr:Secretory carrier-associated membrane protein [Hondaea fermentalgiana]|eukprot:GBG33386.1 Secretory carrier-associated membrane protein [Hondaea fermentalgiana]